MKQDQGFLKLRKIRAAQKIAKIIAESSNRAYLNSDNLMLNIGSEFLNGLELTDENNYSLDTEYLNDVGLDKDKKRRLS